MRSFKELVNNDLTSFFNSEEFADKHIINNKSLDCIVDNDRLMERSKKEYDGIIVGEILYFISAKAYGKKPKVDELQIFDGVPCDVFDVRVDNGVYEIILKKKVN